jgi:transposase-like protein
VWMKNPEFMAEYRAARRAEYRQSMASLTHSPTQFIKSILHTMYHSKKPALLLKAARQIIQLANEANEIEEFAAAVADAEGMIKAAQGRSHSTGIGLMAGSAGHGAKLPRRAEQAIVALLEQRSVAEAARAVGIKPPTLRLWLQDPAFKARYAEAACDVYGPAMRLVHQHLGDAVVVIRNLSVDTAVPEQTRLKAASYRAGAFTTDTIAHLESRLSGMEPGDAGTGEPEVTSQAIGRDLHQRLQQIKSRLQQACGNRAARRITLVHAIDGRAAGTSAVGPDGRQRWLEPPEGFKKDDLVGEEQKPLLDLAA